MSKKITWMLSLGLLGVSGAVGWGLFKVITPSPDVIVKVIKYFNIYFKMFISSKSQHEFMMVSVIN